MLKVHAQKYGDVTIICLRGGVVTGDIATLSQTVQQELNISMVILDFRHVNRIDAGGLGLLLELREQLQSRGIRFGLMNITKLVQTVLEISRLDAVFEILPEGEVLTAAANGASDVSKIGLCAQYA